MTRPLAAALAAVLLSGTSTFAQPSAPAPSRAAVPPVPFTERTLPNGLRVFSAVDRSTPNVTVQVWYDVGGKDDPQGRSGFAHLFEHMMFKATRDMPAEYLDRLTEDVGGSNNASTGADVTNYFEVIPANHLERLIWAEAQRLGSLKVDAPNFRSERAVVEEELRQRVLADPYGRFELLLNGSSYTVHPYKRPVIGSIADLDAAQLADVQAFHATFYRPDNAALIVIGNFEPTQLNAWVGKYFGPIPRPPTPIPRVTAVEPARVSPRTITGYGPTVPLPAVALTFLAPAASSPDGAALAVADAVLSAGKSSRLYRDLVYQSQIAASINSDADLRQQPGLFELYAVMSAGKTLDQGEAALRQELAKLRDASVTAAELARAKNQLVAQALQERETVEGRGMELGRAVLTEGDPARVNTDIGRLQAVTAADVQRVARLWLADDKRLAIRYLPDSARPAGVPPEAASPPSPSVAVATGPETAPAGATSVAKVAAPTPGPAVKTRPPQPVERTLANGLRVIVAHTSDLPLVTAELVVKHGSEADPVGKAGRASLMAALLTEGTDSRSASQIADQVEALGGTLTGSATYDRSSLTLTVLADQLAVGLPIMADVALSPAFAPAEVERQRRLTLDGLSVAVKEPGGLARLAAPSASCNASYAHAAGGTPASLARITPFDLSTAHAQAFTPQAATLVITGDITPEQGFTLAQADFGKWRTPPNIVDEVRPGPSPPPPGPVAAPAGGSCTPRVIAIDLPGTGQAAVVVAAPSIARANPSFYPAEVANAVLGGGYSARLNEEVRVKRGLSYGAGSRISALRDGGLFTASAQTKTASAGEVATLMLAQVMGLATTPIAAAELDARKASLVGEFGRETERSSGLASVLATDAVYGLPLSEVGRYVDQVQAVDEAAAHRAAAVAFDAARATLIVVGDAKGFMPDLKARFPSVELIEPGDLDLDSPTLRTHPSPPVKPEGNGGRGLGAGHPAPRRGSPPSPQLRPAL